MTNVVSFGFLGTGPTNVASFGFLGGTGPTPPVVVIVPGGGGDKAKRDREEYFRKRRQRQKQARTLERQKQTREEPVAAPVLQPRVIDFAPQGQLFRAFAGPQQLPAPQAALPEPLPPVSDHKDDEDLYLLTE
jgi:hypothetical protein